MLFSNSKVIILNKRDRAHHERQLALALFMLGVCRANHQHLALAANDFALIANFFYGRTNFHDNLFLQALLNSKNLVKFFGEHLFITIRDPTS